MPVPTADSPTNHSVSDSTIPLADPPSPSDPIVPKNSTSQHDSLGSRPINPPNRYGDWHYSFTAMAGILPPVPKTYEEAVNSPNAN